MMNQNSTVSFKEIDFNPFEDTDEIEKTILINESQREIWLSCMIGGDPANLAYNESISLDLTGPLNIDYFKKALEKITERHEALRSAISGNGEHFIIYDKIDFDVPTDDITEAGHEEQEQILRDFIQNEMVIPFHLESAPLFRTFLHKLADDHYYFTLIIHHIIADGWSIGIILEDLSKFYNGFCLGLSPTLPKAAQISDYALNQANFVRSDEFRKTEDFWLDQYKGHIPVLDLPTDFRRPTPRTYAANRLDQLLPSELINQLKITGAKAGCSFVNTLLSAFEIFLSYKTQKEEVVIGLPSAGQSATELFDLVGHCVNLLPLRSAIDPNASFYNYLKNRKTAFFDAYEHQQISFGQLVKQLKIKRDHSRVPLIPVIFNIDMGMDSLVSFQGLSHHLISNPRHYETFEIFLNVTGSKDFFVLEWTYNTQLFKASTIQLMMSEFESLLRSISKSPDEKLLNSFPSEKETVIIADQVHMDAMNTTVLQLIQESTEKYPDKIAIKFGINTLDYNSLAQKSDQLAFFLKNNGIQRGDVIGLSVDRSLEMIISLIAILKSGAVYVPLDPEYPNERIEFMLADSAAKVLLISKKHKAKFKTDAHEVVIEEIWQELDTIEANRPTEVISKDDLAYILYTSGSTGKPKGVKVSHGNLVNFLISMKDQPGINDHDRLLAITTISFDIAGLELYLPLICGAEIFIASGEQIKDGRLLLELIEKESISVLQATPSTWQMIIDSGWSKNYPLKALSGGEALPKELSDQLLARASALWNMYGPTETTIWSTIKQLSPENQTPTIGYPILNTQIYIMDEQGYPLTTGNIGEIYIGGEGVAKGYLNRPDLTKEKFVSDKFSNSPGAKLYRTGDLGKQLASGEFQCLGRIDQQVKIRGHRIELGEIEQAVSSLEGIRQTVVMANEDIHSNKHLIAYIILEEDKDQDLSWKERWDTLYNIGAESKKDVQLSDQNLDDTLLEHYRNKSELALQSSEWLQASADRIRQLNSKRIYEIGSGAGQLLFELAPKTELYVATDYAKTAIDKLNEKINASPQLWKHVKAETTTADDFSFVKGEQFDLVLIHSVAQYFPNADYLINVIRKSAAAIQGEGCIFIGDMQGKNSLEMCHAMDHLPHSPDHSTVEELQEVITNRVRIEDEFVADPGFFYNLQSVIPKITAIDVQLRRGQLLNETTKYHYDIWLFVGQARPEVKTDLQINWNNGGSVKGIEQVLISHPSSVLELRNVLNSRTVKDFELMQLVHTVAPATSIRNIKDEVANASGGFDPDIFWKLASQRDFDAHIKWSTDGTDGLFDVTFIPRSLKGAVPENPYRNKLNPSFASEFARTLFSKNEILISKDHIQKWKESLFNELPVYMVPEDFIALKKFPLTPNAKIDRNALPKKSSKKNITTSKDNLPKTKNEQLIEKIWLSALGLEQIKVDEDFFELGGHSLLAVKVMIAIEKETGKRLPLATLFENSTIEKLAFQLANDQTNSQWQCIVPIKITGKKDPVFLIHGGGLNILLFKSIVDHFDEDQPVYGIQALGLLNETDIPPSIEEIAGRYIGEIIQINPEGPYSIAGYSLGGFIAFEIAKQLLHMGKEIKMLGVIDTYAGSSTSDETKLAKAFTKLKRQFYKVPFFTKSFLTNPKEAILYQYTIMKGKLESIYSAEDPIEKNILTDYEREIYKIYSQALNDYILIPSELKVALFRVKKRLYYLDDPINLGWNNFAKNGVEIYDVPGDHKTFLHEPNNKKFASILQNVLDKKTSGKKKTKFNWSDE